MDRALSCTVIVLFIVASAAGPSTSAVQELREISEGRNRYETLYGKPQDFSLDENIDTWPEDVSIRVVGILNPTLSEAPRSSSTPRRNYAIQSEDNLYRLKVTPVQEVASRMDDMALSWSGRKIEVVGIFPRRSAADQDPFRQGEVEVAQIRQSSSSRRTLLFWSILALPEEEKDDFDAPRSTLEALVINQETAAGRVVAVTGTYRGGNLLEDLPDGSRRDPQDWVLNDGPFSIWVTGKKPKGEGFSFDLRSQSDLRWKLAVQGEVEIHGGYIYLRAEKVRLVGPAKEEADSR